MNRDASPTPGRAALALALALALAIVPPAAAAGTPDGSPLTIADLAAYREALAGKAKGPSAGPPAKVGFRALWEHPGDYLGRRVEVRGRPVRRFRQGPFGTFPPLEEAWVVSPAGDPFCLVFPAEAGAKAKEQAAGEVRFAGTFLKLVEYQGGDGPRLAPLIVGPAVPAPASTSAAPPDGRGPRAASALRWTRLDWAVGLAGAALAAAVLAFQHLRRPARPLGRVAGEARAPLFDDAKPPTWDGWDDHH